MTSATRPATLVCLGEDLFLASLWSSRERTRDEKDLVINIYIYVARPYTFNDMKVSSVSIRAVVFITFVMTNPTWQ